ncbi:uncharacterized protein LOC110937329 isoform X3 [Helianthus annuus]|uniref:uncharacterized protein LOC110937329 isoform X3 n=1 Tax=Helianthus annuus TaxID=4232 RepID=UPI000B9099F3|nr:uncharacterized protein LOC110937329 isoform X3 [Helianthus annuus]
MSSHKASNVMENSVELSDGESVELEDEMKDVRDQSSKDVGAKGKRKNASDAKEHFKDIEGMYKGKMVKKKQCIYCKHSYVANSSGTTTSLTRHLKDCTYFQKAQGMSVPMYEKFEKYWGEVSVLMSIASILDPRFKLKSVTWTFERLYPMEECSSRVEEVKS